MSLFPSGIGFEWLRGLSTALIGGGAPAVAKVGAVVATATLAAGVPVAVEKVSRNHAHRAVLRLQPDAPSPATAPSPSGRSSFAAHENVLALAAVSGPVVSMQSHDDGTTRGEADHVGRVADTPGEHGDTASGGSSDSSATRDDGHDTAARTGDGERVAAQPRAAQPQADHPSVTEADRQQSEHSAQTSTVSADQHSGDPSDPSDPPETGDGSDGHSTTTTTTTTVPTLPLPAP